MSRISDQPKKYLLDSTAFCALIMNNENGVLTNYAYAIGDKIGSIDQSLADWGNFSGFSQETTYDDSSLGRLLQRVVSVLDPPFNAVGDGVADDSAAFTLFINFLNARSNGVSGGGLGYVPQGLYRIASDIPALMTNVGLYGDGPQATLIDFQNGSGDCFKIGDPSSASRGQTITGMYLGQTGKTGGTMIKLRNVFNAKIERVQSENNFIGIDVGPLCNSVTLEDIYITATQGASPVCLKFVAGASNAQRSDVLVIRNVVLSGQWSDATCLEWDGAAYTLTVQSLRMLQAKYGMVVKNSANDSSWYPAFLNAHDIEAGGFKQRALWIQAGNGFKITVSDLNNLSTSDPSQGAADLSAVQIDPDLTHSYTRSIQISDTRIGGTQREGLGIDARDVALSNVVFYTTSLAGVGSYPVIRCGANAHDVQLANIRAEEFGSAARSSYAVQLDAGATRVSGTNINCKYCNTGDILDNSGNLTNTFTNITRRSGNPSQTHNGVFPAVRYATTGQTEVRNENESTGGSASSAFIAETGAANVFAQWLVHNGSGAPYSKRNSGSAVTVVYDDFDTHTWRTNSETVKGSLDTGGMKLPSGAGYFVNSVKVVGGRQTGFSAMTGTATKTAIDTDTATLTKLAQRVKAIDDAMRAHGLID